MSEELERIRADSMDWIREAGAIARERIGTVAVHRKADRSPVTDADHAVQEALLGAIAKRFPEDAVISEETQADPNAHASVKSARRCWVVDPIDGTRNYARTIPIFTVSVAMLQDGAPVVGWVFDPMSGLMYSAAAGKGAWVEDRRLTATNEPLSSSSFISIPISRHEALPPIAHQWIDRMIVRNFGSTALHLALLAAGALDAVYCRKCHLWDIAAGVLLVTEAGGELHAIDGRSYFPIDLAAHRSEEMPFMAGNHMIVDQLIEEYS